MMTMCWTPCLDGKKWSGRKKKQQQKINLCSGLQRSGARRIGDVSLWNEAVWLRWPATAKSALFFPLAEQIQTQSIAWKWTGLFLKRRPALQASARARMHRDNNTHTHTHVQIIISAKDMIKAVSPGRDDLQTLSLCFLFCFCAGLTSQYWHVHKTTLKEMKPVN